MQTSYFVLFLGMKKPEINTIPDFYQGYVSAVTEDNLLQALENSGKAMHILFSTLEQDKLHFRYAAGKWTIAEVIQHCIDTERIMATRALRIGRGDKTALPGFEQDDFAANADTTNRTLADIAEEYQAVRQSSISLFKSFREVDLWNIGNANGTPISAIGLGFIIAGHEQHHLRILEERYL